MRFFLNIIFILFILNTAYAQGGKWTWESGVKTTSSTSTYGVKGLPAATNQPAGRYQCAYWTDKDENFWMFGGSNNNGDLNDLWRFNPNTKIWTWVSGAQAGLSFAGNYGPIGVPSANYYPSARGYGSSCWTDNNNNLWLYGGSNSGDDLWKYNVATNQWTLVKGCYGGGSGLSPVFGNKGVPDIANSPGSVSETKSCWTDANNNLWMIGNHKETMW